MNEITKTMLFLGFAAFALMVGYASLPSRSVDTDIASLVGTVLFDTVDQKEAKSLRIVTYDAERAHSTQFEVAEQKNGRWTIPSKNGYPADAARQMGVAIESLLGRQIFAVVSENASQHHEFGVIDPLSSNLLEGGVGTRVTLRDAEEKPMIDLIIGDSVKDSLEQRYVRQASQDLVYVVEMDPESFSTGFSKWIEKDLLLLDPFEIDTIEINDYSLQLSRREDTGAILVKVNQREKMKFLFNENTANWQIKSLQEFDAVTNSFVLADLSAGETVNEAKLEKLKSTLHQLLILDVDRKPPSLKELLKSSEGLMQHPVAASALIKRGFVPTPIPSVGIKLLSTEGEVVCGLKNGLRYVLRFGNLLIEESEIEASQQSSGVLLPQNKNNRYLFVSVEFDKNHIQPPLLEPVPELTPEAKALQKKQEEKAAQLSKSKNLILALPAEDSEAEEKSLIEPTAAELAAEQLLTEYEDVLALNKSRQEEHEKKIEAAQEQHEYLNDRFKDWFYVIKDAESLHVRLSRNDVIQVAMPVTPPVKTEDQISPSPLSEASEKSGSKSTPGLGKQRFSDQPPSLLEVLNQSALEKTEEKTEKIAGEKITGADTTGKKEASETQEKPRDLKEKVEAEVEQAEKIEAETDR